MVKKENQRYFYFILLTVGYIFSKSSIEKIEGGKFADSLSIILAKFADKNPYPWFKSFLSSVAIPNSVLFGNLTMWGEFFVGISILASSAYLIISRSANKLAYLILAAGCLGGVFLNSIFWLAAGWTSASTESLNLLLVVIQACGFLFAFSKYRTLKK